MSAEPANDAAPLLEVHGLKKYFPVTDALGRVRAEVKAVDDVSFRIAAGETYGLVGESGCGKSTTGRALLRLIEPTAGAVIFEGRDLNGLSRRDLREVRRHLQMVFQDPYSSLNPRKTVGASIKEALTIHGIGSRSGRKEMVLEVLARVGLQSEHYDRLPHEFSGGQRQRIGLARALILGPRLAVCDESVSALDVSVQSQIINLLMRIQREERLSYLFIAHDLSVVRHISNRIGVMYLGRLVEEAPTDRLFSAPGHPYTQALISAIPVPDPTAKRQRIALTGEIPSPLNPPSGCVFHTRCPLAQPQCRTIVPERRRIAPDHFAACHLAEAEPAAAPPAA